MPVNDPSQPHGPTDTLVGQALARLRRGDATAKNDLFNLARGQFERMARKLFRGGGFDDVRRWEQTDDVVQGLFIRMSSALDALTIETPRDFFRIAGVNIRWELKALRERHAAKKRPGRMLETNVEHDPKGGPPVVGRKIADVPSPDDWEVKVSRYLDVIEGAAADDREVLDLVFVNGLTREEAAGVLELSLATFNRRHRKARLWLGRHLRDLRDA